MSSEVKLILGISIPIVAVFFTIIIWILYWYERKYHPKIKTNYDEIETPEPEFFEAKALRKRVHIYYVSELNIPKSVTEYFITFLLETGEEREFSLSKEMFEKIEEGEESTLVLLNNMFFDFGEGEEVENFEE